MPRARRSAAVHGTDLRRELEAFYALDTREASSAITHPAKGRWLRRVALIAPAVVMVQGFFVYLLPMLARMWNRPEFIVFRLGE